MSSNAAEWQGFAYGEDLDGVSQRSLGFRLLTPAAPAPWCAEVEALAHQLQAAPYPDHWPAAELFCSVLLAERGRRVAWTPRRAGVAVKLDAPRPAAPAPRAAGGRKLLGAVTVLLLALVGLMAANLCLTWVVSARVAQPGQAAPAPEREPAVTR